MLFVLGSRCGRWASSRSRNLEAAQGFDVALVNALAATALIALALFLVVSALLRVRSERRGAIEPARVA